MLPTGPGGSTRQLHQRKTPTCGSGVGVFRWCVRAPSTAREGENSRGLFELSLLGRSDRALARERSNMIVPGSNGNESVKLAKSKVGRFRWNWMLWL